MKIIKKGKIKDEQEVVKSCHKCETEFLYDKLDVRYYTDIEYVLCPLCKAFIVI